MKDKKYNCMCAVLSYGAERCENRKQHTKRMREEYIRQEVQDVMANSMACYGFENVIDDSGLSKADKEWAKKNLDWKVVRI